MKTRTSSVSYVPNADLTGLVFSSLVFRCRQVLLLALWLERF